MQRPRRNNRCDGLGVLGSDDSGGLGLAGAGVLLGLLGACGVALGFGVLAALDPFPSTGLVRQYGLHQSVPGPRAYP